MYDPQVIPAWEDGFWNELCQTPDTKGDTLFQAPVAGGLSQAPDTNPLNNLFQAPDAAGLRSASPRGEQREGHTSPYSCPTNPTVSSFASYGVRMS